MIAVIKRNKRSNPKLVDSDMKWTAIRWNISPMRGNWKYICCVISGTVLSAQA